ncbi:hypothetical protein [Ruminococcus sp. Marseille-P6503]|uniref:hypothetical protein n=1 Tax=Ruminococcus sp. Marseille-P6503 TaxID=2364796 RepID=UPI000F545D9E|nr:hypothetical protein [Ruminococcus sp. Marseille-P6503]
MTKNSKIAILFRIAVIATAVFAIVAFVGLIMLAIEDSNGGDDEELFGAVSVSVKFFRFMAVGAVVSTVLSCIAQRYCKKVSVVFRTLFMGVSTILILISMKVNSLLALGVKIIDEYGDFSDAAIEDFDLTRAEIREIENIASSESDIMLYIAAIFAAAVVFTVIALTSIHYLTKKKNDAPAQ